MSFLSFPHTLRTPRAPLTGVVLVLAASTLLGLSACSAGTTSVKPQVIASFYPLEFIAERVVGNHADVTNLTHPGAEPHDLELTTQQAYAISGAAVAIYEKGLQPAVDQSISNDPPRARVNVTDIVKLSAIPPGLGNEFARTPDGTAGDPHFWQDPTLLAEVADRFASVISKQDPKNAAAYRANNAKLQADLSALDAEFRAGLAHCVSHSLVVSHDAFEHLPGRRALAEAPRGIGRPDPHRQDHDGL
jgi:zinc transport system substrate-binding protein